MLLRLEGESLVRRAARRALGAGLSPIVVVLGHDAERVRGELSDLNPEFVLNQDFTGPTSGSLHLGLKHLSPGIGAVTVMLADMVLVSERMLAQMMVTLASGDAPLVASRYAGVTAPPFLFRRELFDELLSASGDGVGRAVVQRHLDEALFIDWPAELLTDIDTPEDLAAAEALVTRLA